MRLNRIKDAVVAAPPPPPKFDNEMLLKYTENKFSNSNETIIDYDYKSIGSSLRWYQFWRSNLKLDLKKKNRL